MIRRNTVLSIWGLCLALLIALAFIGPGGAVRADDPIPTPESLIEGLSSDDPAIRAAAIAGLAALGDPSAASALLDLLADPDPRLGLYAAQQIGALASPENLPILREGLNHSNADVRWRTALILGEMGDPRAVPALARALSDPEVLVHRTAAESLVKLGGAAATGALVRALGSSKPSVVFAAKNGLLEMGKPAVTPLAVGLSVGNAQRRANAATLLGYIGDSRALPALRTAVEIDEDETVRTEAQWAIDQITGKASR